MQLHESTIQPSLVLKLFCSLLLSLLQNIHTVYHFIAQVIFI